MIRYVEKEDIIYMHGVAEWPFESMMRIPDYFPIHKISHGH